MERSDVVKMQEFLWKEVKLRFVSDRVSQWLPIKLLFAQLIETGYA